MQPVTLYGKGAIMVHADKETIRSEGGQITVPPTLVEQVISMGFSRVRPDSLAADGLDEAIQELVEAGEVTTESDVATGEQVIKSVDGLAKIETPDVAAIEGADQIESADVVEPTDPNVVQFLQALEAGFARDEAIRLVWPAGDVPDNLPDAPKAGE